MKITLAFLILITNSVSFAQGLNRVKAFTKHPLTIIENKGQVKDQYGKPRRDIEYKTGGRGLSVFIGNGQLHYQWSKAETISSDTKKAHRFKRPKAEYDTALVRYSMYRLDMELVGANPDAVAVPADKQAYYENYHTTALNTKGNAVCAYNKITYKNIYPHIDWALYIKDGKLEYDFIVNPGGNVNDIQIKYNGATGIAHTDGSIKIKTPLGDINERNLYAYQQTTGAAIAAKFRCRNNTVRFSLPATYDMHNTPLVIDPTLDWATYFGGEAYDQCKAMAFSGTDNVYVGGTTRSITNVATTGAYNTYCGGDFDAYLAKFNNAGALQWATYYGGNGEDHCNSITCDLYGNIYLAGSTKSTDSIATTGAHQTTYGGGFFNGFLAKFDSTGGLQWGTYYGGSGDDVAESVVCDNTGNVFLSGGASSLSGIATPGSYQGNCGGDFDAFISKFSGDGALQWGTYYGGSGTDVAYYIAIDKANNLYLTGYTTSIDSIATTGAYQTINRGNDDAFLAKFNSNGALQWGTYYGGIAEDQGYGISCDTVGGVFIMGTTSSSDHIATLGSQQDLLNGYNDAYLAKFSNGGLLLWATYYGAAGNTFGDNICIDNNGNVFIAGETTCTDSITTAGSYQDVFGGGDGDAFLAQFSSGSGILQWATYYGGSGTEGGIVACDPNNNIYLFGVATSLDSIATPGSYEPAYGGGDGDGFIARFSEFTNAVPQQKLSNTISIYPNPAFDMLYISIEKPVSNCRFYITDVLGRAVFSKSLKGQAQSS